MLKKKTERERERERKREGEQREEENRRKDRRNSKHNHVRVRKVKIRLMRSGTANTERRDGVAWSVGGQERTKLSYAIDFKNKMAIGQYFSKYILFFFINSCFF